MSDAWGKKVGLTFIDMRNEQQSHESLKRYKVQLQLRVITHKQQMADCWTVWMPDQSGEPQQL